VENETAVDPMSEKKWQRSSLRHLSVKLSENGHPVSHTTVERLLKKLKYSLKANGNVWLALNIRIAMRSLSI